MKIGNLPQATVLNDEDMLPVVQDGKTKKVSAKKFFEKEPVVENKYNPVSENAQSGLAVAQGIEQTAMPLGEFTVVAVGNLINLNRLIDGYYVNESTGNLVANDTYAATHFIPIESGSTYALSQKLRHAWYDINKQFISGANSAFIGNAPDNACYIRISVWKQNQSSLMFTQTPSVPKEYVPYSVNIPELQIPKSKFDKDDMLVDGAYIGANIFDNVKTTDGAYASELNGTINTGYSNYFYSDFIKCKPNTTYSANKGSTRIVAYKSDYSYSGGAKGTSYTTNDDAEYIRISHLVEHKDALMIVEGEEVPDYYVPYQIVAPWLYTGNNTSSLSDKKLVCFGDSITYNGYTGVITEETGIEAINVGMSSARYAKTSSSSDVYKNLFALHNVIDAVCGTQQWSYFQDLESNGFTSQWNQIQKLSKIDFNTVDFVSFAYGTNDYRSGTPLVNTDDPYDINTVTGALRYAVKTLLASYPHLRILVSLPIYRFFTDASNNITSDGNTADFGGGTLAQYCEAIAQAATSIQIPYVDCYNGGGINEFNRLHYFDITDGTHPKKAGQDVIGHCIASWLKAPGVVQSYIGTSGQSNEPTNPTPSGSTATWEFVEEITVAEAGNVDRNTTPSGELYKNLYKDLMVTVTNPDAKPCAFVYIYRVNCLNRVSVTFDAGDFILFKSEMIMEGLAQWSGSKTKSDGYGSNMVVSHKETTDNIQRVLVGTCATGTIVKIYGRRA